MGAAPGKEIKIGQYNEIIENFDYVDIENPPQNQESQPQIQQKEQKEKKEEKEAQKQSQEKPQSKIILDKLVDKRKQMHKQGHSLFNNPGGSSIGKYESNNEGSGIGENEKKDNSQQQEKTEENQGISKENLEYEKNTDNTNSNNDVKTKNKSLHKAISIPEQTYKYTEKMLNKENKENALCKQEEIIIEGSKKKEEENFKRNENRDNMNNSKNMRSDNNVSYNSNSNLNITSATPNLPQKNALQNSQFSSIDKREEEKSKFLSENSPSKEKGQEHLRVTKGNSGNLLSRKIKLPDVHLLLNDKIVAEGAGNEPLFISNLDIMVMISVKEKVQYAQRFCLITKESFTIYEDRESYITFKEALLSIPISYIFKIYLCKLSQRIPGYDHFIVHFIKSNEIMEKLLKIDTFFFNDNKAQYDPNSTDEILIFKTNEKMLAKKWYVVLNYLKDLNRSNQGQK